MISSDYRRTYVAIHRFKIVSNVCESIQSILIVAM